MFEPLEARCVLAVSSVAIVAGDAIIDGTGGDDDITIQIFNQGLGTEFLRVSDPGGVTPGTGFAADGANAATTLT